MSLSEGIVLRRHDRGTYDHRRRYAHDFIACFDHPGRKHAVASMLVLDGATIHTMVLVVTVPMWHLSIVIVFVVILMVINRRTGNGVGGMLYAEGVTYLIKHDGVGLD